VAEAAAAAAEAMAAAAGEGEGKNNLTEAAKDEVGAAAAPKKSTPDRLFPDFDTSDDKEGNKIDALPPKHFSQATKCPVGSGTAERGWCCSVCINMYPWWYPRGNKGR